MTTVPHASRLAQEPALDLPTAEPNELCSLIAGSDERARQECLRTVQELSIPDSCPFPPAYLRETGATLGPPTSILDVAMGQLTTRVLGMNSLPIPVEQAIPAFKEHFEDRARNIRRVSFGKSIEGIAIEDVDMGLGIKTTAYVFGRKGGSNTALVRKGWWKCRLVGEEGP